MYEQAAAFSSTLPALKDQLQSLANKLHMDVGSTITEDLISEEGLKELVQHALENLHGELELLHLSLLRKHDSVKHETSMYNIIQGVSIPGCSITVVVAVCSISL